MAKTMRSSTAVHNVVSQGEFDGNRYEITRDGSNAFLSIKLQENVRIILYTNLSNILAKSANIRIEHHPSFSFKDIFLFRELFQSNIIGPGEVLLSSPIW
jgi:uncharacterized protein (AIM24 family)